MPNDVKDLWNKLPSMGDFLFSKKALNEAAGVAPEKYVPPKYPYSQNTSELQRSIAESMKSNPEYKAAAKKAAASQPVVPAVKKILLEKVKDDE